MHRQTPKKLTVPEAAAIMGVTPQFLRIALQQERLPFGTAVKMKKRWAYYVNARRFFAYLEAEDMRKEGQA